MMIDLALAQRLKQAGLQWWPTERDFFAIPGHQMDSQIFVVSELTALVQLINGQPAITFHGTSEWALDFVLLVDTLWLPSESQLREAIMFLLGPHAPLRLERAGAGYRCVIAQGERTRDFAASGAEDAYAEALISLLEMQG
jgi:hypothetical protein